jgi:uncharacterized protein YlxW (UPF0749 family)
MKVYVPLPKPQPWVLPVTIVCLALGALVAFMLRVGADDKETPENLSRGTLIYLYSQEKREKEAVQKELADVRKQRDDLVDSFANEQKQREGLSTVIDELRVRAGTTAVEGKGIVITIDDADAGKNAAADTVNSALLAHDVDLLQVVNELRAAGAEAIAINDQRVAGSSAVRCVGPVIRVNDRAVSAPFVVRAIGNPDVLFGAVNLPFGILDQLKQMDMRVEVAKRELIRVPALTVMPPIEVGKPVSDGKVGKKGE